MMHSPRPLADNYISYLFFGSLRARFEQMQQEEPKLPNARVKVNRFVVSCRPETFISLSM